MAGWNVEYGAEESLAIRTASSDTVYIPACYDFSVTFLRHFVVAG
jgi:hypothetical protein